MILPDRDAFTEHLGTPVALIVLPIMSSLLGDELQNNHPCVPQSALTDRN